MISNHAWWWVVLVGAEDLAPRCPQCALCEKDDEKSLLRSPPWFALSEGFIGAHVVATRFSAPSRTAYLELLEVLEVSTFASLAVQADREFVWLVVVPDSGVPAEAMSRLRALVAPHRHFFVVLGDEARGAAAAVPRPPRGDRSAVYIWTNLTVGTALHACATRYLKTTLAKQQQQQQQHHAPPRLPSAATTTTYPELLVSWGAVREWVATGGDLGSLRSANPLANPAIPNVATKVVVSSLKKAAAGEFANETGARRVVLVRFFPLRLCHVRGGDACATATSSHAAAVSPILLKDLERNYGAGRARLDVARERLAYLTPPRENRWPQQQTRDATPGVTLVVQTTCERLWSLRVTCRRWEGPIIIVLFVKSNESCAADIEGSACFSEARNSSFVTVAASPEEEVEPTLYPVNRLRNVGIGLVRTTHFFVVDADFWPDAKLHGKLNNVATRDVTTRRAVIVPSFEVDPLAAASSRNDKERCRHARSCAKEFERAVPSTFKHLLACLDTGNCYMFDDARNPEGHSSTDLAAWLRQEPTQLRRLPCVASYRFEPYVMVRKAETSPVFDPSFTGYGKNKISFVLNLRLAGFYFVVLPRAFLTHVPHGTSKAKAVFTASKFLAADRALKQHRIAMNSLFEILVSQIEAAPPSILGGAATCSPYNASRLLKTSRACHLTKIAKDIQIEHAALRASTDWKRRVHGYVHIRNYIKC
ncbi:hypothetical protein CTAYLR_004245 [Chrysophaeum taylorii]|uniref:Uncharacterized protein n=1 Tax=Chrysophaeum taylorii TaxID=2483200 RepID=A0AAD7UCF8_9STRA|nr:hypothetical protein CTAYLR_004245 [Chrysophaeum taylorii]